MFTNWAPCQLGLFGGWERLRWLERRPHPASDRPADGVGDGDIVVSVPNGDCDCAMGQDLCDVV